MSPEKPQGERTIKSRASDGTNHAITVARDMFAALFHANPIPTVLLRQDDMRFLDVNEAFLESFELQRDAVIGNLPRSLNFRFAAETDGERNDLVSRLARDGIATGLEIQGPAGEVRTVLASIQQIRVDGTDAFLVVFTDVTERKNLARLFHQALESKITLAELRERRRISQVLHDDLQQRLFAIKTHLSLLRDGPRPDPALPTEDLAQLDQQLGETIQITRELSADIGPIILKSEGLIDACVALAEQMRHRFGLHVVVQVEDPPMRLEENLRVILYQTIRELLFNIVKHAGVKDAKLVFGRHDGGLRITVQDGGNGFDVDSTLKDPKRTYGLSAIQRRLGLLCCDMRITSKPGDGVTIEIDVNPNVGRSSS